MKLFKAIDALDGTYSFFLVYPSGEVAVMLLCPIEAVKHNQSVYMKDRAERFADAIDPILVEEW